MAYTRDQSYENNIERNLKERKTQKTELHASQDGVIRSNTKRHHKSCKEIKMIEDNIARSIVTPLLCHERGPISVALD